MSSILVQRARAHFNTGYADGYREEFPRGLTDGLSELIQKGAIDGTRAAQALATHQWGVEHPVGWDSIFERGGDPFSDREDGLLSGRGAGYDQGYEDALAQFGYSRRYGAIPALNRATALLDNKGVCVYCNNAPTADVDHITPLKVHWRERGAVMGDVARSNQANDLANLVGTCAACNRSKGAKILVAQWQPPGWQGGQWWPFGPARVIPHNSPPPYW